MRYNVHAPNRQNVLVSDHLVHKFPGVGAEPLIRIVEAGLFVVSGTSALSLAALQLRTLLVYHYSSSRRHLCKEEINAKVVAYHTDSRVSVVQKEVSCFEPKLYGGSNVVSYCILSKGGASDAENVESRKLT